MGKVNYFLALSLFGFLACGNAESNETFTGTPHENQDENGNVIGGANGSGQTSNSKGNEDAGKTLAFKKETVIDKIGTGGPAFTALVPKGWKMEGEVVWDLRWLSAPAFGIMKATSPDGMKQFEIFPAQAYFYNADPSLSMYFPLGSNYYGATVTDGVPNCINALKYYVAQKYRGNCRFVEEKPLGPVTQEPSLEGIYITWQTGLVKIEYTENGKTFEENIYGKIMVVGDNRTMANFYLTNCYGMKAPKGELKENMGLFETTMASIQTDLKWYNAVNQISQQLLKQNGELIAANSRSIIERNNQISRSIKATSSSVSSSVSDAYKKSDESSDRTHANFIDAINEVENYKDPSSGTTYKMPTGYTNAYTNSSGDYIMTTNPNYNPNANSTISWTELDRQGLNR